MNRVINQVFMRSHLARRLARFYYLTPIGRSKLPALSPEFQGYLQALRRDGVVAIRGRFTALADFLDKNYLSDPSSQLGRRYLREDLNEGEAKTGVTQCFELSLLSPEIGSLFFDEELCSMLFHYYGRQPFYRNLPLLKTQKVEPHHEFNFQGKFHADGGLRQLSYMMLLNDITEADTHMEYAVGSHQTEAHRILDRDKLDEVEILKKYEIFNLVGKKGDLFIFDAGNGYHRARYQLGTRRSILHINVTTGAYFPGDKPYERKDFDFLTERRPHVRSMLTLLTNA